MEKKYKVGMFGGKFMPFHKGHLYCTKYAADMCETLYLILFHSSSDEVKILEKMPNEEWLKPEFRYERMKKACADLKNVIPISLDLSSCRKPDGSEDWDAETPLVLNVCGKMDAVFGSEPDYKDYFDRAYPWAKYEIIDTDRKEFHISGTMIRGMSEEERKKWML